MRLRLLALAAALLLGACSDDTAQLRSGGPVSPTPSQTPEPAAAPTVFALGYVAQSAEMQVVALEVDRSLKLDEGDSVEPGLVLFAIRVRIRNLTVAEGLTANSAEWAIEDAEGQAYEEHCCGSNKTPELPLRELQPSEQATGWITFEVPPKGSLLATWSPGLETIARFRVR